MTKMKKGFTLVELVIVIAVIAILASVLIPTFAGILERARENTRLQKITSARDEFVTENLESVSQMEKFVMQVDGSLYLIGENGSISKLETTALDGVSPTTFYTDELSYIYGDVKIYAPADLQIADFQFTLHEYNKTATVVAYTGDSDNVVVPSAASIATNDSVLLKEFDNFTDIFTYFGKSIDGTYVDPDEPSQEQTEYAGLLKSYNNVIFNVVDGETETQMIKIPYTTDSYIIFEYMLNTNVINFDTLITLDDFISAMSYIGYEGEYYYVNYNIGDYIESKQYYGDYYNTLYCNLLGIGYDELAENYDSYIAEYGENFFRFMQVCDAIDYFEPTGNFNANMFYYPEMTMNMLIENLIGADILENNLDTFLSYASIDFNSLFPGKTFNYKYENKTFYSSGDYIVRTIGQNVFKGSTAKTITIPSSVQTINYNNFEDCPNLTNIYFSEGLTTIRTAFNNCPELKELVFPDSVTQIPAGDSIINLAKLQRIVFPSTLTSLYSGLVKNCPLLSTVVLPTNLTSFSPAVFSDLVSLKNLEIPVTVTNFSHSTNNDYFESISFVGGVTENSKYTIVNNCVIQKDNNTLIYGMKTSVIPDTVTAIGSYAFYNVHDMELLNIPASVTTIENNAFYMMPGLQAITVDENNPNFYSSGNCLIQKGTNILRLGCENSVIPDNVTQLGWASFSYSGIETLDIPVSVIAMDLYSIENCDNLVINYAGTKAQWGEVSKSYDWKRDATNVTIVCTNGTINY